MVFLSGKKDVVNEERVPGEGIDDAETPPHESQLYADHHYQMPRRVPEVLMNQRQDEEDQAVQERLHNGSN